MADITPEYVRTEAEVIHVSYYALKLRNLDLNEFREFPKRYSSKEEADVALDMFVEKHLVRRTEAKHG